MNGISYSRRLFVLATLLLAAFLFIAAPVDQVQSQSCGVVPTGTRSIATIATGTSVASSGWSINLQNGTDNLPFITYMGGGIVRTVKCGNAACTSGNISTTPGNGQGASSAFIATNGIAATQFPNSNNPLLAYYVDNGGSALKLVDCRNANCTSTSSAFDSATGRINVNITSAPDGDLVLIGTVANTGEISARRCADHQCTQYVFGDFLKAGGTITNVYRPSVLMPGDDRLILAYTNGSDLIFYKCSNTICSNGATVTLDAGGVSASLVSMSLGTNGFPVIAYRKNGQVKIVRCGNAMCNAGNTVSIIDPSTNNSGNISVAVGPDNIPVLSYYKASPGVGLYFARCANAACTGTATIRQITTNNSTNQENMIRIGAGGRPGILYRESNGLLNYLSCWDTSCSPSQPASCTSSQPAAPTGITVVEGDANGGSVIQTRTVRIDWAFNDTGSGCGASWGHSCNGQNNQFTVRITGPAGFTTFNTTLASNIRTFTTGTILGPNGNYSVQVCAVNGSLSTCATRPFTKQAYATGTITGSLNERTPNSVPIACSTGVRANYANTLSLTPNSNGYTTSCSVNPAAGVATSYTCSVTLNNVNFDPNPNGSYTLSMSASAFYDSIACGAACTTAGSCANIFTPDLDANGGTTTNVNVPLNMNISSIRSFYKVKNLSYYDADGVSSIFPVGYQAYDTDDSPVSEFFNRGEDASNFPGVGIVLTNGVQQAGAPGAPFSGISPRGWSNTTYTKTASGYGSRMVNYVKNRKNFTTITSLSDPAFTSRSSGVFLVNGDLTINTANVAQLNNKNVLIVASENLNIATNIIPASATVAFAAKMAYVGETVSEVRALILGDSVSLVSNGFSGSSTTPLKIHGSITSGTSVDMNRRVRPDAFKPSVYIIADPDIYISLLPFISVIKYEWRQIQ